MRLLSALLMGLAFVLSDAGHVKAQPNMPGFDIEVYATGFVRPGRMAFDSSGVMYLGSGWDWTAPEKLYRVGVGGTPVERYGDPIPDPDAVLFDAAGDVSGTPGSVLVGGGQDVYAVRPDETVVKIFDTSTLNISDLKFDNAGRLLVATNNTQTVYRGENGSLTPLFTSPSSLDRIAVDVTGQIYTREGDVITVRDSDGNMIDPEFASGLHAHTKLAFGLGGVWGTDLYVLDRYIGDGELRRYQPNGDYTVVGTGCSTPAGIAFGPDGALYFNDADNERILRITPVPEPSTLMLLCIGAFGFVACRQRRSKP